MKAFTFIAADETCFGEFIELSGVSPATLRHSLSDSLFLAAILEFLLARESLLLSFCQSEKIDPCLPGQAQSLLAGTDKDMHFT